MPLRRRGANAVEFALVLPLMLALITGAMDIGWYFGSAHAVEHAAILGARAGALANAGEEDNSDPVQVAETTAKEIAAAYPIFGSSVTASASLLMGPPQTLKLTVTAPYEPLMGLVPLPLTRTFTSAFPVEQ